MKRKKYFILAAVIILSVSICLPVFAGDKAKITWPFDNMRDYIAALEARGKVLRIKEVDQDKYEGTAFMYRMIDKMGSDKAPAVMFEKVKINGKVLEGPVFGNIWCGWDASAMIFGVENVTDNQGEMFRATREKLLNMVKGNNGEWKRIKPVISKSKNIPCKEVILKGDEVDLLKFPWFKNNPS